MSAGCASLLQRDVHAVTFMIFFTTSSSSDCLPLWDHNPLQLLVADALSKLKKTHAAYTKSSIF